MMEINELDPFQLQTDTSDDWTTEYAEGNPGPTNEMLGRTVRLIGPRGSILVGRTGEIVDVAIQPWEYPAPREVYLVKLFPPIAGHEEGIWHKEEQLEIIK